MKKKLFSEVIFANGKTLILMIVIIASQITFAQESTLTTVQNETKVEKEFYELIEVDVKPDFPGGLTEFYNFVGNHYRVIHGLKGRVMVQFVIEKDGSITDITVLSDLGHGTDKEAIRVLKKSPKWKPGKKDGKNVRVLYSLPINIY